MAKTHKTDSDASGTENNAQRFTVSVKGVTFGNFQYDASREVSAKKYAYFANEGFKAELQSASAKADAHVEFGGFVKNEAGKMERVTTYKRGKVAYSDERAEVLRSILATSDDDAQTAVTVSRYVQTAILTLAKDRITAKAGTETSLVKLANACDFQFDNWEELTVDNVPFVEAVAEMLANI